MRKIMALALAALLLCAGAAQATEWPEGLSPSKPYTDVPEIDLDEQLGYIMFYPGGDMRIENACQRLFIYLPREDVKAGEGTLHLISEKDGEVWSTSLNNAEAVRQREITEAELDGLLWSNGTCFEILLPKTLAVGETYFVNMTRGCIVSESGVENVQVGGTDSWRFTVEGDYGVSNMEYRRPLGNGKYEEQILAPQTGDEIRFDLVLDGDAAIAAIFGFGGSVDFLTTTYVASSEVTGTVLLENPVWGVMFLDADGNELDRVEFWQNK